LRKLLPHSNRLSELKLKVKLRPGRVSTTIKKFAETINAIYGSYETQKPIGKEKYFGTRAVRLMIGSRIPFFVVQAPPGI
jgi:hypothetical protein